jgi:hypothetical protein
MRQDLAYVVLVLGDEFVPFQEGLGADARVYFAVCQEG